MLRAAILSLECSTMRRWLSKRSSPRTRHEPRFLEHVLLSTLTAKKWDMAAAVASHLVKVEPENEAWWINLAYSVRRSEGIEQAEAILLRARAIHPRFI